MKTTTLLTCLASAASTAAQCTLPTTYNWTSTGILAQPKAGSGWTSLREFTAVPYQGKYLVYGTTNTATSQWGSMAFSLVNNFTELATASQMPMDKPAVSSTLFFFAPKKVWVLAYQWGASTFAYKTSMDPTNPNGWSAEQPLFTGTIEKSGTGPIDAAVIGDHKDMYLFFAGNNGKIYRASMPIDEFPSNFGNASTIALSEGQAALFEGVQVYTIKGEKKYLMLVEAFGRMGRYFHSFTATSLGGNWTENAGTESNPFAGKANTGVTWTNDISQVEIIRDSADQRNTIDLCNMQALYQGRNPNSDVFWPLAMRPALLTLDI